MLISRRLYTSKKNRIRNGKSFAKRCLAKLPILDLLVKIFYVNLCKALYKIKFHTNEVQQGTFLFECFKGKLVNDSPLALYEQLLSEKRNYQYTWVLASKEHPMYFTLQQKPSTQVVLYGTSEYFLAYSTHQYWIVNCRIPFRIVKKSKQIFVQCWHGTPLKRIGLDISVGNNVLSSQAGTRYLYQVESKMIDHFISPSEYASNCFMSSFALKKSQITEVGYPRNDQLVTYKHNGAYINSIKEKLKIANGAKVVLYAPTYRDDSFCNKENSHVLKNPLDSKEFLEHFDESVVFLYRGHYFTLMNKVESRFIDVSNYDSVNDILLISDLLVTDYSSLFFDYAILERPCLFFMYDREVYENKTRGFYLDIDQQLPGTISTVLITLASDILRELSRSSDMKKFNALYNPFENGLSSSRVINAIIKKDKLCQKEL